jgi:tetratricopeptide (TPR) repeat protein
MESILRNSHERNILAMIKGLLLAEAVFQDIFRLYKQGRLQFSDIGRWVDDKGHSLLYELKEKSHRFFRRSNPRSFHRKEWLLDLAIGSIFHEAMKLRENIYQIEFYRPKYLQHRRGMGSSSYERDYLHQFERIISKAELGVMEGMDETRSLFRDAKAQLMDFFKENSENPFLVRFLLGNRVLLRSVYGPRGPKRIFELMFPKGYLEAYQVAARSYLESGHYDLSKDCLSKALRMDPKNPLIQFLLHFSTGMEAYYKSQYAKALSHFSRMASSRQRIRGTKESLKKAEEACHKIVSELKDEKKTRGMRRASSVADQLKKCYLPS